MGKRGFKTPKEPKEKVGYIDGVELEEMGARIVDEFHSEIGEARIKYLFRTGKWQSRGVPVYSKSETVSNKWKYLTGNDFVVIICKKIWDDAPPEFKKAILDRALEFCCKEVDKFGNAKFYIQHPTVTDFPAIIRRYGLWSDELKKMNQAKLDHDQISMFDEKKKAKDKSAAG